MLQGSCKVSSSCPTNTVQSKHRFLPDDLANVLLSFGQGQLFRFDHHGCSKLTEFQLQGLKIGSVSDDVDCLDTFEGGHLDDSAANSAISAVLDETVTGLE